MGFPFVCDALFLGDGCDQLLKPWTVVEVIKEWSVEQGVCGVTSGYGLFEIVERLIRGVQLIKNECGVKKDVLILWREAECTVDALGRGRRLPEHCLVSGQIGEQRGVARIDFQLFLGKLDGRPVSGWGFRPESRRPIIRVG